MCGRQELTLYFVPLQELDWELGPETRMFQQWMLW
jgi:hypothetical protein